MKKHLFPWMFVLYAATCAAQKIELSQVDQGIVINPISGPYGASCDGTHDDSGAFTAASLAASKYYAATGVLATVLIPSGLNGNCNIMHQITYYSGTHFLGSGGTIINNTGTTYSFSNANPGDGNDAVWFDHVRIVQTTLGSLPVIAYVGGQTSGSGGAHKQFWITDSDIQGGGYAIKTNVFYQSDNIRHTLNDVIISRNHIWCQLVSGSYDSACRDAINLNGDTTNITVATNIIEQRDDAAIAFTSSGGNASSYPGYLQYLTPTNATVIGNVMTNVGAGLDFSGGNTIEADGNVCIDTILTPGPCIRFILGNTNYPLPSNIKVVGGIFHNDPSGPDPANIKMDFSGQAVSGSYPVCNCSISDAEIGGLLYFMGNGFQLNNNRITSGARLVIAVENGNATNAVTLQNNIWLGTRTVNLTAINGGITRSAEISDYYDGRLISQILTPAQSGTGVVPSTTMSLCGQSYNGSSVTYNPACFTDQVTWNFGNNSTGVRLHAASLGNSRFGAVEEWASGAYFTYDVSGGWPSVITGNATHGLFLGNNFQATAAEVDFYNAYQTSSNGALDSFSFYANRPTTPQYLGGIRGDGSWNAIGGYRVNGTLGFSGTKTVGSCSFTFVGGILTRVTGC